MKYLFIAILIPTLFLTKADKPVASGDDIIGTWLIDTKSTKVEFYKCGSNYCGKIVWMEDSEENRDTYGTPFKDVFNPDKDKRSENLVGQVNFKNFTYNADDGKYEGKAYKYSNGKTYSGYAKMNDDGTLYTKGGYKVMGMMVGVSYTWTRVD